MAVGETIDESCRRESGDNKILAKVAFASAIGTAIEYYDFTLYATATATIFGRVFFPDADPFAGSLAAFAAFFVGYCARPLGGLVFGHFGDRLGRKYVLVVTILIMGLGTVLVGLMPTYAQIGIWSPLGLVAVRILQGIGIGGEYGGGMSMLVEYAPIRRRGFFSSLMHIGVPAGFLLPIVLLGSLSKGLSNEQFLDWGWRVPFLLSVTLVGLGLFIRAHISETPIFKEMQHSEIPAALPLLEAVQNRGRSILLAIGAKIAESGLFNIFAVFTVSVVAIKFGVSRNFALNAVLVGCVLECFMLPIFGALSDRIGRRPVYVMGMVFQILLTAPFAMALNAGNVQLLWLTIVLGLGIGHGSVFGAQGAFFSNLFPPRVRCTGLSLVQQIGAILGGGLSPLLAVWAYGRGASSANVAVYMAMLGLISAACALGLRDQTPASEWSRREKDIWGKSGNRS